ncbi:hypothetical protein V1478_013123 [Vespula squamosa]|uniref:Uncharacterized protein n=1 Tax=Vespula squamosa TaxID=30214 RepID=A0ABD2A9X1_VESSQ
MKKKTIEEEEEEEEEEEGEEEEEEGEEEEEDEVEEEEEEEEEEEVPLKEEEPIHIHRFISLLAPHTRSAAALTPSIGSEPLTARGRSMCQDHHQPSYSTTRAIRAAAGVDASGSGSDDDDGAGWCWCWWWWRCYCYYRLLPVVSRFCERYTKIVIRFESKPRKIASTITAFRDAHGGGGDGGGGPLEKLSTLSYT